MTTEEKFFSITDYKEYQARKEEFKTLNYRDKKVIDHLYDIYPKLENSGIVNGVIIDLKP